jgi:hypothetical protein
MGNFFAPNFALILFFQYTSSPTRFNATFVPFKVIYKHNRNDIHVEMWFSLASQNQTIDIDNAYFSFWTNDLETVQPEQQLQAAVQITSFHNWPNPEL